jgi:hypothetical protein
MSGRTTDPGETMFLPRSDQPLTWRTFIDGILAPQGTADLVVKVRSYIEISGGGQVREMALESVCALDVRSARIAFLEQFKPGENPRPVFWQPNCVQ